MVNGIPETKAMFRQKAAKVVSAAKSQAKVQGEQVASAMRYLAPREQGDLIKSIRVEDAEVVSRADGSSRFIGVIVKAGDSSTIVTNDRGTSFQNARLQENGTKRMPAHPYFNPAWRANRSRVKSAISRAVRKAWLSE